MSETLPLGKHKGKTYQDILKEDLKYCQWVLSIEGPSGAMASFRDWLQQNNVMPKPKPSPARDLEQQLAAHHGGSMSTRIDFDNSAKPRKRKKSFWGDREDSLDSQPKRTRLGDFLDDGFDNSLAEGLDSDSDPPLVTDEDLRHAAASHSGKDLMESFGWTEPKSTEHRYKKSTSGRDPLTEGLSSSTSPTRTNTRSPLGRELPKAWQGQTESQTKSNAVQSGFEGTLIFEVCSPTHFRVQAERSSKGNRKNLSTYLPSELFNLINRFRSKDKLDRPIQGIIVNAPEYNDLLELLRDTVNPQLAAVTPVPGFVLRAFPAFCRYAPTAKLKMKCANILLRQTSPRTLTLKPDVDNLIGPRLSASLKPFQREALEFALQRNGRVLIGDEMGLGKTLGALSVIAFYRNEWPALVVCPSSIRFQWKDQALQWLNHYIKVPVDELIVIRNGKTPVPKTAQIIITSYELLVKMTVLHSGFKIVVCDESHYLKSMSAKRSQVIVPLLQSANRALLLSGTPALNKPSELYQQIVALLPDFAKADEFASRYCEQRINPWSRKKEYYGARLGDELNTLLTSTVMIRRLKKDVQTELPPKLRSKVPVEIAPSALKEIVAKMAALDTKPMERRDDEAELDGERQGSSQSLISQLFRKTGEAKVESVCDYVDYLLQVEHKFIVFAHHRIVLDSVEARLKAGDIPHVRIDGQTPQANRETLVKRFQGEESCRVAVLSITACGHGLNMTAAGTAVFAELYWVPGQILQAEDRCHRMGTTHTTINIHYCIAERTLDETVWGILQRKWAGITSSLNGLQEEFRDDAKETTKMVGWRQNVAREKVVEKRGSILVTADEECEEPAFGPNDGTTLEGRRQSTLTSFFSQ